MGSMYGKNKMYSLDNSGVLNFGIPTKLQFSVSEPIIKVNNNYVKFTLRVTLKLLRSRERVQTNE